MQPVQDLTIDATVSRDAVPVRAGGRQSGRVRRLGAAAGRAAAAAAAARRRRQRPAAAAACRSTSTIDRATAARFGITPATVDNALYDAFGQRIVSTIFTQSNQYRVILEADPALQQSLQLAELDLSAVVDARSRAGQVPLSAIATIERADGAAADQPSRPVSRRPRSRSTWRRAPRSARRSTRSSRREHEIGLPASVDHRASRARRSAFQASLGNELLLILAAIVTIYIVLGVLYESFIHPITILSTLPSAGVGALLALMIAGDDLDVIAHHRHRAADRHRQEERDHDDRLRARRRARARASRRARRSTRPACCASGRS